MLGYQGSVHGEFAIRKLLMGSSVIRKQLMGSWIIKELFIGSLVVRVRFTESLIVRGLLIWEFGHQRFVKRAVWSSENC